MRLVIATPLDVVVEARDVRELRAEDPTGSFGVRPGHGRFLTALVASVVAFRTGERERYCAVRGGVLVVAGNVVTIATREAIVGDDLEALERNVVTAFREGADEERRASVDDERLRAQAVRKILGYLRPDGGPDARRAPRFPGEEA
jgi:F-type H+-transporting ATPase subunit epsilon